MIFFFQCREYAFKPKYYRYPSLMFGKTDAFPGGEGRGRENRKRRQCTCRNNFCKAKLAWKSFTEDVSNMDGMLKVSRAILQKRQPQVGHLKRRDGIYTETRGRCWTPFLMNSFQIQTSSKGSKHLFCIMSSRMTFLTFFPLGNLKVPSNPLKKGKAPGPDGIDTEVLQNLDGVSLGRLALIYNVSLALGYVPERWRGAKAVLIPKVEKSDHSSSQSFRPISLTSFLLKGLGRVIVWYLEEIGVVDALSRHEHAFRKGRSTFSGGIWLWGFSSI